MTYLATGHAPTTPVYLDIPDLTLPAGTDVVVVAELGDGAVCHPIPLADLPALLRVLPERCSNVEILRPAPTALPRRAILARYAVRPWRRGRA